jgi:cullin-associated NEDD8-dissociated protein 1
VPRDAAPSPPQGVWGNVTIVSASDFGRTLTSNGLGTDHAWGGNHFVVGGSVKGGQVLGNYPSDLSDDGSQNIGQ